jgi:hypothetical protein
MRFVVHYVYGYVDEDVIGCMLIPLPYMLS